MFSNIKAMYCFAKYKSLDRKLDTFAGKFPEPLPRMAVNPVEENEHLNDSVVDIVPLLAVPPLLLPHW